MGKEPIKNGLGSQVSFELLSHLKDTEAAQLLTDIAELEEAKRDLEFEIRSKDDLVVSHMLNCGICLMAQIQLGDLPTLDQCYSAGFLKYENIAHRMKEMSN